MPPAAFQRYVQGQLNEDFTPIGQRCVDVLRNDMPLVKLTFDDDRSEEVATVHSLYENAQKVSGMLPLGG